MKTTKTVRILLSVLGFVLLLLVWGVICVNEDKKHKPPTTVRSFRDFLQQMPMPARVQAFTYKGTNYFEVWGHMGSKIQFPSGPPSYIFDPTGRLVDWTYDRGDAGNYHRKWGRFKDAHFISVEEMLHALGGTNSPAPVN